MLILAEISLQMIACMRGACANGASCGILPDRTAQRAPVVMNLRLHHKQMHYRQSPFLNDFKVKTRTKVVTNILQGHHQLKIKVM